MCMRFSDYCGRCRATPWRCWRWIPARWSKYLRRQGLRRDAVSDAGKKAQKGEMKANGCMKRMKRMKRMNM